MDDKSIHSNCQSYSVSIRKTKRDNKWMNDYVVCPVKSSPNPIDAKKWFNNRMRPELRRREKVDLHIFLLKWFSVRERNTNVLDSL